MLITVNDIPITGQELHITSREYDLQLGTRLLQPAAFDGTAYRSGTDVRIVGKVAAVIEVSCHRCLENFPLSLAADVELYYRPLLSAVQQLNEEISVAELGILQYQDNTINLGLAVKDTIILETPMKLLCRPDCRGLCGQCGLNLNAGACNCRKEEKTHNPFHEFFHKKKL